MVTKQRHGASKAVRAVGPVHSFLRIEIMSGGGVEGGGGGNYLLRSTNDRLKNGGK